MALPETTAAVDIDWLATQQRFTGHADETVLAAALRAGVPLAVSCRNGTCRTCIARLVSGEVRYRIEWPGLSAEEKREGFILPCVAHPVSALVIAPP
jgi:ferredoxin